MTLTQELELTIDTEALHKSLAAALREMADKLDPPVAYGVHSVGCTASGGACISHGGYVGPRCPRCFTA